MMTARIDEVVLERHAGGVRVLHLNAPQSKNALSETVVRGIEARLLELEGDQEARVCVLRGLPDIFCSGGSKDMLRDLAQGMLRSTDILLTRAILEAPVPTLAAMEGHAVGGGLTLGLACDIVLLARESRYGLSFMNMGFTPGMGTTELLSAALGEPIAAELMFTGEMVRGSRFESRSLVNYVLPRDKVLPKAMALAERIAEKPRASLLLLKRALSLPKRLRFERGRTTESFMHDISFRLPDTQRLIEEAYQGASDDRPDGPT